MFEFPTREDMLKVLIEPSSICAEIGVFDGNFSKKIEELNPSEFYMIDLFTGQCDSGDQDGNNVVKRNLDQCYATLLEYARNRRNLRIVKSRSVDALNSFPDNFLDMVYIDGDHSYEGTRADLEASIRKVKHNGWIFGHDYEMNMAKARTYYHFGVKQAVDEFCQKYRQVITAKAMDGCVSFGIQVIK